MNKIQGSKNSVARIRIKDSNNHILKRRYIVNNIN